MSRNDKLNIKTITENILKEYGEDIIVAPGRKVESISTGSLSLDLAIGVNGLPRGRICDFYGRESAGKTMLAASVVASVQKNNGVAVYIDAENGFDEHWASILGVDLSKDKLIRISPDYGEQAFDIAEKFIRAGVDLIVIDSTAALVPKNFVERSMEDTALIGLQARMISLGLQRLTPLITKTNSVCLFIGQVRKNIGANPYLHGEDELPTGGLALGFYSSVRIRVRRKEAIKDAERVLGHRIECLVKKNKVAPPLKKTEFDIYYDRGIDQISELFSVATSLNIIQKPEDGIKYYYGDKSWRGQEKLKEEILNNPSFRDELLSKVKEKMGHVK